MLSEILSISFAKLTEDNFDSSILILSLFNRALTSPTSHLAIRLESFVFSDASSKRLAIALEEARIFASDSSKLCSLINLISFCLGSSGRVLFISSSSLSEITTGSKSGSGKYL